MPTIKYTDESPEGKAREKLINEVLPKTPLYEEKINDGSFIVSRKELTDLLLKEIEIYKAFPRKGRYELEKFNPRNSRECFMGQGFTANGSGFEGWTDYDLVRYRNAIGKINHRTWGDVTLLEIWGGDHFEKHKKMVQEVFKYCNGERATVPKVKFWVNPLYANNKSGTWEPHEDEIYQKANREHMIKIANYCEIKERMKKAGVKSCMDLAIDEKDDPVKKPRKSKL